MGHGADGRAGAGRPGGAAESGAGKANRAAGHNKSCLKEEKSVEYRLFQLHPLSLSERASTGGAAFEWRIAPIYATLVL